MRPGADLDGDQGAEVGVGGHQLVLVGPGEGEAERVVLQVGGLKSREQKG